MLMEYLRTLRVRSSANTSALEQPPIIIAPVHATVVGWVQYPTNTVLSFASPIVDGHG